MGLLTSLRVNVLPSFAPKRASAGRRVKSCRVICWPLLVMMFCCGYTSKSFNMGVRQFNNGNFNTAIGYFQKAVKQDPTQAIVHYNLGMAYFKVKQYSAASAAFQSAAQLDERFEPLARFYLGLCYYQTGDKEKARRELQWVAQICANTNLGEAAKEVIKVL